MSDERPFDYRGLGPYEATPCYDCSSRSAQQQYVRRGHRLVLVCTDCAINSGDDNLAAHRKHCVSCRAERPTRELSISELQRLGLPVHKSQE